MGNYLTNSRTPLPNCDREDTVESGVNITTTTDTRNVGYLVETPVPSLTILGSVKKSRRNINPNRGSHRS